MSKIQVNEIVNHFDNGAPDCPRGLTIAGVATAATLDVTGNVSVGGTLTYDDVTNIDSVGIITAQAGVKVTGGTVTVGTAITLRQNGNAEYSGVVLAGIDPRGGGGTGLYIDGGSGAIVAGATGTNAILRGFQSGGSENFRFSADGSGFLLGDVGIGTDNPSDDLSILSTANSLVIGCKDSTRGNHIFQLLADDPAGNGELRLYQNSASGTHAKTVEIASSGNSYINSGSVGIGTDNPDSNSQLHTIGTSYWPILVKTTSTGGGGIAIKDKDDTTSLYTGTGGGSWLTGSAITDGLIRAQNNLLFASNGNNEAMRLDSSGRLLIGITEGISVNGQNCAFQVEGVNAATSRISIINRGNNSTGGGIQIAKSRGTIPHNVADDDQVGGIFFCAADGNDFDGQSARIECYIDGLPGGNDVPGRLTFSTTPDVTDSPVERLRIDSSGRLLIPNTNVDNFKLQVAATNGATVSCQNYQNNDDGAEVNFLKSRSTTVGGQGLLSNNDYIGRIFFRGSDGGNFDRAVEIAVKVDGAPAASDMPGRIEFMTTPSGSDTPTATMTLKANKNVEIHSGNIVIETSGKGIDFSAATSGGSSTSSLLDDYEEGTYTPVLSFGGGSTGITYSMQQGYYNKVGRMAMVNYRIECSSVGSSTGEMRVSLPFTVDNSITVSGIDGGGYFGYSSGFDSTQVGAEDLSGYAVGGQSYIVFSVRRSSGDASTLNHTDVDDNLSMSFTVFYNHA